MHVTPLPAGILRAPLILLRAPLALGLAALALNTAPSSAAQTATIQALGFISTDIYGRGQSAAYGLNNQGQVVGYSYTYKGLAAQGPEAFLYSGGKMTDVGNFGTDSNGQHVSYASSINTKGDIVGDSDVYDTHHNFNGTTAALLYSNNKLTNLGNLGVSSSGVSFSLASGINDSGQIVGTSDAYDANHVRIGNEAFLYANGKMTGLGYLGTDANGHSSSTATGINSKGDVVGASNAFDANHTFQGQQVFLYAAGKMTSLGSLGTDSNGMTNGYAKAVNDSDQVVGTSDAYDSHHNFLGTEGFLFSNGTMTGLGYLGTDSHGHGFSTATGINSKGDVVGYSNIYDTTHTLLGATGFLFSNGTRTELSSLLASNSGWSDLQPDAINDNGQIVGSGVFNGNIEAFLITPVPESSTLVSFSLLALGGIVIAVRGKKTGSGS